MICLRCHQDKALSEFPSYYLARNYYWCRDCKREYQRAWKRNHPEYANRNRGNKKYYETHREQLHLYQEKWRQQNRERVEAHAILNTAIKQGIIQKPNECSTCGKTVKLVAHHDDYSKPLEVSWLCSTCHKKLHSPLLKIVP